MLRYFNAAGSSKERGEDHDPETHLIPLILDVAQGKREKLVIFGNNYSTPDGICVRDYIHVEDLADVHILALESGYSVKEVVGLAEEVTGREMVVEYGDWQTRMVMLP
jgi:UDP-glucose 4-epimerase